MDQEEAGSYREAEDFSHVVMEENEIPENSGPEMSRLRGEAVEAKNGALERGSMEEIGDHRLPVAIDLDLHSQENSEMHEMSGNFRLEMTGEISEKGHCPCPLMRSPFVDEGGFEEEEGVIGTSIDAEGDRIRKSGTMLHRGAGPVTEIGRGKCAMTEIVNVISRPAGGRTTFEGSGRNAKEMIVSEGSNLFVQTPAIPQGDNKRPSHLVQLR